MLRRFTLLAACALGACHEYDPSPCLSSQAPAVADTAVGAKVDGNSWVIAADWPYQWPGLDTTYQVLDVGGLIGSLENGTRLGINVYGFAGPGEYPVSNTNTPGTASGYYDCHPGPIYIPLGWNEDNVTVLSYDSLTGEVAGTFRWHSSPIGGGPVLHVDHGTFRTVVTKY